MCFGWKRSTKRQSKSIWDWMVQNTWQWLKVAKIAFSRARAKHFGPSISPKVNLFPPLWSIRRSDWVRPPTGSWDRCPNHTPGAVQTCNAGTVGAARLCDCCCCCLFSSQEYQWRSLSVLCKRLQRLKCYLDMSEVGNRDQVDRYY